ncbi:hypothetical protein [Cypionkella psychrotolerans]|uniref:hypothetical protein n=1 Tax=Cypionkella psychrotolerans TaxID=1678131 RepID=UPI0006B62860|nr:hypothetical protein [Cypionkella psychrotolerans]
MTLTTGALLRRIIETPLSASAHKLATLILDGIAWKDGYNGLDHGTAAFTLTHLSEKMGVSRQHLSDLLSELAESTLALVRWKPHGKFAPWLFRFGGPDARVTTPDVASSTDDTSQYKDCKNKTIFTGRIDIDAVTNVYHTPWAEMIKAAKTSLACWNVDTQAIWDRFLAFNKARGNSAVPAGFLLGFMRKWRASPAAKQRDQARFDPVRNETPQDPELVSLIRKAPTANRHFHESDLCRKVGKLAYEERVACIMVQFSCLRFPAMLAVHGLAIQAGEIMR